MPQELLSCMISTLHRKLCEQELLSMRDRTGCIRSVHTSVPPCWSVLLSKIYPSLSSKSSNSTGTGYDTPSPPITASYDLGRSPFLGHELKLQQPISCIDSLTPKITLTSNLTLAWKGGLPRNSKLVGFKILCHE